jgi:hypothetical protein
MRLTNETRTHPPSCTAATPLSGAQTAGGDAARAPGTFFNSSGGEQKHTHGPTHPRMRPGWWIAPGATIGLAAWVAFVWVVAT